MPTYARIKQVKGKENERLIEVLRYIAKKEGYMSCGNVQFRRLYYVFLKDKFKLAAEKYFSDRDVDISYRQYKRLRKYVRGKFSINTAVYLVALYDIMLEYRKKTDFVPCINDITYTEYIVDILIKHIKIIINRNNGAAIYLADKDLDIFRSIHTDLEAIDNVTGVNSFKLYNNIW